MQRWWRYSGTIDCGRQENGEGKRENGKGRTEKRKGSSAGEILKPVSCLRSPFSLFQSLVSGAVFPFIYLQKVHQFLQLVYFLRTFGNVANLQKPFQRFPVIIFG